MNMTSLMTKRPFGFGVGGDVALAVGVDVEVGDGVRVAVAVLVLVGAAVFFPLTGMGDGVGGFNSTKKGAGAFCSTQST